GDVSDDAAGVRRARLPPLRVEMRLAEPAEPRRRRAAGVSLRGAVPAGDDHARQQPGHRLVLDHRPRVAGLACRLRGLARSGQFRRRWPATPQSGELQTRPGMSNNPAPSLVLLSAVTSLAF